MIVVVAGNIQIRPISFIGSPPSKRTKLLGQTKQAASATPKTGPAGAAAKPGNSGPSLVPPDRTHISELKEYCEQLKWPQPKYTPIPQPNEQCFQFQVMVKIPTRSVTATGSVCGNKTDAKHSAAQAALKKLPKF